MYVRTYDQIITLHRTYTTQAGFSSVSALQMMASGGTDLENVSKARLAAGQIFSIIDLVRM